MNLTFAVSGGAVLVNDTTVQCNNNAAHVGDSVEPLTGKLYFEVFSAKLNFAIVGVSNANGASWITTVNSSPATYYVSNGGALGSVSGSLGAGTFANDRIGIAIDVNAKKFWIRGSAGWVSNGDDDPVAGSGGLTWSFTGDAHLHLGCGGSGAGLVELELKDPADHLYPTPTGFSVLSIDPTEIRDVVNFGGVPADKAVNVAAFTHSKVSFNLDGVLVSDYMPLGDADCDPVDGSYAVPLLDGYADPINIIAFDPDGEFPPVVQGPLMPMAPLFYGPYYALNVNQVESNQVTFPEWVGVGDFRIELEFKRIVDNNFLFSQSTSPSTKFELYTSSSDRVALYYDENLLGSNLSTPLVEGELYNVVLERVGDTISVTLNGVFQNNVTLSAAANVSLDLIGNRPGFFSNTPEFDVYFLKLETAGDNRYYAFNEGTGSSIADVNDPANTGTATNYTDVEAAWKEVTDGTQYDANEDLGGGGGPSIVPAESFYWSLDGDSLADVGGIDLTNVGSVGFVTGVKGQAAKFNGDLAERLVTSSVKPSLSTLENQTLACWVNLDSLPPSNRSTLINNHARFDGAGNADNSGTELSVLSDGRVIAYGVSLNSESHTDSNGNSSTSYATRAISSALISPGQWHHIVAAYTANSITIYIDGVKDGTVTVSQSRNLLSLTETRFSVGQFRLEPPLETSVQAADGLIDEVKIWDSALTDVEVAALYAQEALALPPAVFIPENTGVNIVISNNGRTVAANGNLGSQWNGTHSYAVPVIQSGDKVYMEFIYDQAEFFSHIGIKEAPFTLTGNNAGNATAALLTPTFTGNAADHWAGGVFRGSVPFGTAVTAGTVFGMSFDYDNMLFEVFVDGNSVLSVDLVNAYGMAAFAADVHFYVGMLRDTNIMTARTLESEFTYSIPAGFTALGSGGGGDHVSINPDFADVQALIAGGAFTNVGNTSLTVTANGNAAVTSTNQLFGQDTIELDGTGDYISVTDVTSLNFRDQACCIEFWIYPTDDVTANQMLWNHGSFQDEHYLALLAPSGQLSFASSTSSTINFFNSFPQIVTFNAWNHIAMVREVDGSMTMYINGVGKNREGSHLLPISSQDTMTFGASTTGATEFAGSIGQIRYTTNDPVYTEDFTPPIAAFPTS